MPEVFGTVCGPIPGSALGLRFECDLRNGLAREVFFTGNYEPPETMLIRRLVDRGAHLST